MRTILDYSPKHFLVDEQFTWNFPSQVWKMLVGIVGDGFGTTLENRHTGMCNKKLGLRSGLVTSKKTLGFSPWTSQCSRPKCRVPWSFKSHDLKPLVLNMLLYVG